MGKPRYKGELGSARTASIPVKVNTRASQGSGAGSTRSHTVQVEMAEHRDASWSVTNIRYPSGEDLVSTLHRILGK